MGEHPIVGILGGMGPEATVDLLRRVVAKTPARDDADHIHMLIDNNPHVPSRIAALIDGTGPSPGPELVRMARQLEANGAGMLAIACNTAHWYAPDIARAVGIELLNMIELAADRLRAAGHRQVGLLASTAVVRIGLYEAALAARGLALSVPAQQPALMEVIRAVKAGDTGPVRRAAFRDVAEELAAGGVDVLLVACTELSVLTGALGGLATPVIDALDVLASEIVDRAVGAATPARAENHLPLDA